MVFPLEFVVLVLVLLAAPVLQRAALGAQRQVARRAWRSLDEELLVEAPVAYKAAQVVVSPAGDQATLVGITAGVAYAVSAGAVCPRRRCDPPGFDCRCGFYAFKRRRDAVTLVHETLAYNGLRHKALLTVTLQGNVLEYEQGYRAQRQTVLGVAFSSYCHRCEQQGARRRADRLAAAPTYRGATLALVEDRGRSDPFPGALPLRPVCGEHVPPAAGSLTLKPAELAGLLGAEVQWLDERESAPTAPG
jgi:hypothetical protein